MKADKQHKEVTSRVIQSSKGGGRHIVDNRPQEFFSFIPQNKMMTSSKVIQGKIYDLPGMKLSEATPSRIGMETTWYGTLWKELNDSSKDVSVAPTDGQSSYDAKTKCLYFKQSIIEDLLDPECAAAVKVSHIATITHEMSHAHDNLIKDRTLSGGGNVNESTQRILETELRAWAREALSAYQAGKILGSMDEEKKKLIDGWKMYDPSLLDDIKASRGTNHVVARIYTYVSRGIRAFEHSEIVTWVRDNKEFINAHAMRLKNAIDPKISS